MSRIGYARLSNDLWRSPAVMKMLAVNPVALSYYVVAISYASDNLTDGVLEETVVRYVLRVPQDVIDYLVDEGKWEEHDGGWTIHNYDKWQNSRADIEAVRAKDRERKSGKTGKTGKTTPVRRSGRNPDGIHAEADVNPSIPFNQNQNQNQNTSSNEEVEEARASAPTAATGQHERMDEDRLIDVWEPDASCIAHADELARSGQPRVDLGALADTFRRKLHARGLAAYRLRATPRALSAEFCTWIDTEAGIIAERSKGTPVPDAPRLEPHRHTWNCTHVNELMADRESEYSHERDGYKPSPWMSACQLIADQLNNGSDPIMALAALDTASAPDLERTS